VDFICAILNNVFCDLQILVFGPKLIKVLPVARVGQRSVTETTQIHPMRVSRANPMTGGLCYLANGSVALYGHAVLIVGCNSPVA
jgi:hypothetical protein